MQDFLLNDDHVTPVNSSIFAINMLVNTASGRTYTWSEVEKWLSAAGFVDIVENSAIQGPAGIITAIKPS